MLRSSRFSSGSLAIAGILLTSFLVILAGSAAGQDVRIQKLFSTDPASRAAAKDDLLNHPDPALLPALLHALPTSTGTNRDNLLDVLGKYDDARKIPVYIALAKNSRFATWPPLSLSDQLVKLGAPAAQSLLEGCAGEGEDYARWAGEVVGEMQDVGVHFLITAVESTDECKHQLGDDGLSSLFGDADIHSGSRADIDLAVNAVIDDDPTIREAARSWFDSWKGKENQMDFSGIVEALIHAYQSGAPPETMVKIAQMLSDFERPRVNRFMRAAVNSPNPDIQQIAHDYLTRFPPAVKPKSRVKAPKTTAEKIEYLTSLPDTTPQNANSRVLPFLKDADARVRAKAAETLGELNAASTNPREEREEDPESVLPDLRLALKDSSADVRAAAISAFDKMRSEQDAPLIAEALRDPDNSVVLAAESALNDLPDTSAAPALTEIYKNEKASAELRDEAFAALVTVCDPSSTPIFLAALETPSGVSFPAAQGLLCTLTKKPDPSALQPVLHAQERTQEMVTRDYLVRAIGATKNPGALPVLERLAKSHNTLAPRATEALGLLGDRRALPILAELLRDTNHDVRLFAAWSFSKFSDFTAPPELISALVDSDGGISTHAANALIQSHDPKAIEAVIAKLPDRAAMYLLGKSHDSRALPGLLSVLQNPANATDQRAAAASALGELGDPRAVENLIATLNDDNFAVAQSTIAALATLKDKRAIEPLKQAMARWSTGNRQNAQSVQLAISQALFALGASPAFHATGSPQ